MKSKVFILYTGGTFGMKSNTNQELEPSSWEEIIDYLPAIKNQTFFHYFSEIDFTFETLEPVIDSSDITPEAWGRIALKVEQNYLDHDGFIIIHGTDTLAYSASALSFIFENLSKPIVLTGAQLPIFHPRTDGIVNLSNAIYIAGYQSFGIDRIPEVCICFNDDVLRGNRAVKTSTNDFEGFSSPNYENLANLEQHISINKHLIYQANNKALILKNKFSDRVVNVTIFPGYSPKPLIELVRTGKLEGIVLKTFGAGNLPNTPQWAELVNACERYNTIILATTQCPNGQIELGQYASSNVLNNRIVVDGKDITSEAALTKLMWVIGNFEVGLRCEMLSKNLRGEISSLK
ncbi:MAG: L-asparaginase 1 [Bacteroidetes bacterium]|nr:MAG: L-asparaginase 1 [Bacteroidota bacterium]